jgi:lipid-binding SYLF domain-containing protein
MSIGAHPSSTIITKTFVSLMLMAFVPVATAASLDEKRADVRTQSKNALSRLYEASPSAKAVIEHAAGYATFENFGIKIGPAGGGKGTGLAVATKDGKETFMQFVEVQAGLGLGVKKYSLVFVFENERALDDFINKGWESGGQTTAAAKHGDTGTAFASAVSVSPGVWLYQTTAAGLAADVTVKTTKYYKDDELN